MSGQDKQFAGVVFVMVPVPNPNSNLEGNTNPYGESESEGASGLLDPSNRQNFIFRVYKVLTLQLVSVIVLTGVLLFLAHQFRWIPLHPAIFPLLSIFLVPVAIMSSSCCCSKLSRKSPENIKLFLMFTIFEAISATTAVFESKTRDLVVFAGITLIILLFLTLFTFQNACGFSKVTGLLVVLPVGLTLCALNFIYVDEMDWTSNTCVTSLFTVVVCGFLVWETQSFVQIGGKRGLTPHDVIYAALKIHLYMFCTCFGVVFLPVYIYQMMEALNPQLLHSYCMSDVDEETTRRRSKINRALKLLSSQICKNYGE